MSSSESHPEQVPAYLIIDTESVPDGKLLSIIKYPGENLNSEDAVARAQEEARASSPSGSDFLPLTFQYPVAACVLRVGADHSLQAITCLDAPQYRPRKIVESFWAGVALYRTKFRDRIRLITF